MSRVLLFSIAQLCLVLAHSSTLVIDIRIRKGDFVKCPTTFPVEHGSLRVVSQDDLDVNAVYVKYGRPPLKIVRRFPNVQDALEIIDTRLLDYLDRSKPVYLVDNTINLNGTRCDIHCCKDDKTSLDKEDAPGFASNCIRLTVDDGARCELRLGDRPREGVCESRLRTGFTNERWVECFEFNPSGLPSHLTRQSQLDGFGNFPVNTSLTSDF